MHRVCGSVQRKLMAFGLRSRSWRQVQVKPVTHFYSLLMFQTKRVRLRNHHRLTVELRFVLEINPRGHSVKCVSDNYHFRHFITLNHAKPK
jgi:hypothetical protein